MSASDFMLGTQLAIQNLVTRLEEENPERKVTVKEIIELLKGERDEFTNV